MSSLLRSAFVLHIFLGIGGIVLFSAISLMLVKDKWNQNHLKLNSLLATLAFILSWIFGGFYYSTHYGKAVKEVILAGSYPWIHKVLMETKEHVFLFLPFLSIVLFTIAFLGADLVEKNEKLKREMIKLVLITTSLGISITLFGILISGAVNKTVI